ncbi:MAG: four helix bundle protein [Candidatus Gracilibacteria bacterium]|nr:four helix bundle protein [Candidatus Gracilibacteria bacterium]
MLKSYRELIVWQKSMELVDEIYKITDKLPKYELYSLSKQMRNSAVSIPSNIAEGSGRITTGEFVQFLGIANASCLELDTQVSIAKKRYVNNNYSVVERLLEEVQKMLNVLIKKLRFRKK